MPGENTLKLLVCSYNELLEVRKGAIGVYVSENCVESPEDRKKLEKQLATLDLNTRLGRSSIRDTYIKLFKRDSREAVVRMLKSIGHTKTNYLNKTHRRSEYGSITRVAFCPESDLSRHLRGSTRSDLICDLRRTWHMDFKQLDAEDGNKGLLSVIGITRGGLIHWWTGDTSFVVSDETSVWKDAKNLALRLVGVLDKVNRKGDDWCSLSMVELDDRESQHRLDSTIPKLMELGQSLIRLLFIRQDNADDILPLYEMVVPVVYACAMALDLRIEDWKMMGLEVISFLEAYTSNLCAQKNDLVEQLGAGNEMKHYEDYDRSIISSGQCSASEEIAKSLDVRQKQMYTSLREEIAEDLKKIGLHEKQIIITKEEPIGDGSFAAVLKCREEHGHQELAVKFLKFRPNNPDRVKNRLLREASLWSKLRDEKFITLLGFCVDPTWQVPGLLSPYCKYTLATYLAERRTVVNDVEKLCYLYEIASGISFMHKHEDKLAHGDLRPHNVLLVSGQLGTRYNAVLSDFGVSYALEDNVGYDMTSLQQTNDLYLAPELLVKGSGKEGMVTIQGDIYAFGCVFIEVMYNLAPFYYYDSIQQVRKEKKSGNALPALEMDILKDHWVFLKQTWDPKPKHRPSADGLMLQMHRYKM